MRVLEHLFSDHLPIAVDVRLPDACLASCRAIGRPNGERRHH